MKEIFKAASFSKRNTVRIVKSGNDYFQTLEELLKQANSFIHLQMYIFDDDETGWHVCKLLKEASLRGVIVFVLVDGYASQHVSSKFIHELLKSNVRFKWFDPLLKSKYFYLGRRMHHKIVVVDGRRAMVGGINVSDRYNDTVSAKAWLDFAVLIEGEAVREIQLVCERRVATELKEYPSLKAHNTPLSKASVNECEVGVRVNDWVRRKREITNCYLEALNGAISDVIIMSPYFLPGGEFIRSLENAAKRGVSIQLILSGLSDIRLAKYAERYMYRWLFKKNITLFEYQKTVLHGKLCVMDSKWVTTGSYNINNISAYASIELNVEIKNEVIAKQTKNMLSEIILYDCIQITEQDYTLHTHWFNRLKHRLSYYIFRFIFFLFTFYFRQRE